MTIYDVMISGAGPAGSALAIELASEGYSVLLMDAARFPRDKPCGDYVSPRALARLDALGCGPEIRALGCSPIRSSRLYLNRDRLVAGELPKVAGLPAHGFAVPRRELDDIIYRRALRAGAEGREGCRVAAFEVTREGVAVTATRDGKPDRALGRLLVGADGATSAVARAAGLRANDNRYTLASMRSYVHGLTVDHTIMYFDESYFPGYGWIFPVRPGLCNIGVGMVSESLIRGGLRLPDYFAKFQRFVRHVGQARGVEVRIESPRGWPIHTYGGARKNYFERGLLIGEAGSFVDPINGEGIPLALESARIAARTIRDALRRGDLSERSLARYERDFRGALDPDLDISDLVLSMVRNRHLLPVWLQLFRGMCRTAERDPRYAEITGGILGGVVPMRQALTPEMFARALWQGPGSLWEQLRGGGARTARDWLADGVGLLRTQVEMTRAIASDGPWFRAWLREVEGKQRNIGLRALRARVTADR